VPIQEDPWRSLVFDMVANEQADKPLDGKFTTERIPPGKYKVRAEVFIPHRADLTKEQEMSTAVDSPAFSGEVLVTVPEQGAPEPVKIPLTPIKVPLAAAKQVMSEKTQTVVAALLADIDHLRIMVEHQPQEQPKRHSLMLCTAEVPSPDFYTRPRVTREQMAKLLARLAADGYFDRAIGGPLAPRASEMPPKVKKQPGYILLVSNPKDPNAPKYSFLEDLSLQNGAEVRALKALRSVLTGEAANAADVVLAEMEAGVPATRTGAAGKDAPVPEARLESAKAADAPVTIDVREARAAADAKPLPEAAKPQPEDPKTAPAISIDVRGHVVDDATGKPISNFSIQGGFVEAKDPAKITWGYYLLTTGNNPKGEFSRTLEWSAGWRARIIASGYVSQPILAELPKDGSTKVADLVVRMKRGRQVSGHVFDHAGKPVKDAGVYVVGNAGINLAGGRAIELGEGGEDKKAIRVATDADGAFTVTGVGDDADRIAISSSAIDLWVVAVPKGDAAVDNLEVRLPQPGKLIVRYNIAGAADKTRILTQLHTWEMPGWSSIHNDRYDPIQQQVEFVRDNLAPGDYTIDRSKNNGLKNAWDQTLIDRRTVKVKSGKTTVTEFVRLTGAPITGQVVGLDEGEVAKAKPTRVYIRVESPGKDPRYPLILDSVAIEAGDKPMDGKFATERIPPGKYTVKAEVFVPEAELQRHSTGIVPPAFVGEVIVTVPAQGLPEPVKIPLAPFKFPANEAAPAKPELEKPAKIDREAAPPAGTRTAFKGWELYVWQEKDETFGSLFTGSNRNKSDEEISKAGLKGIDAIERGLREIRAGQSIVILGRKRLDAPPKDAGAKLAEFCKSIGLKASVILGRDPPAGEAEGKGPEAGVPRELDRAAPAIRPPAIGNEARNRYLEVEGFLRQPEDAQVKAFSRFYRDIAPRHISKIVVMILSSYPEDILKPGAFANPGGDYETRWGNQLQAAAARLTPEQVADQLASPLMLNVASHVRTLQFLKKHPKPLAALVEEDLDAKELPQVNRGCVVVSTLGLTEFADRVLAIYLADTALSEPAHTALIWLKPASMVRPLLGEIEKNPRSVIRHGGLFQGPLQGRPAEPVLVKLLDSVDADVRYGAAYALYECTDATLAKPIAKLAKDVDPRVQEAAINLAMRLPVDEFRSIRTDLLPLLGSEAHNVKFVAMTCFAKRKDAVVGQMILAMLKADRFDPGDAVTVMQAMNALADSSFGNNMHEWGSATNGMAIAEFEAWLRAHKG
jgi:hypothetical protein